MATFDLSLGRLKTVKLQGQSRDKGHKRSLDNSLSCGAVTTEQPLEGIGVGPDPHAGKETDGGIIGLEGEEFPQ